MNQNAFREVCSIESTPKWDTCISREKPLYEKDFEIRSEFARDYTRVLHCTAYRRLKHKTQVFFATSNDHICTRIEHVNHVASVSDTIVKYLGLNSELVCAIAIGHDLGHAPFGHAGETILKELAREELHETFWHEKNGLWMVDKIETLTDMMGEENNLSLTYAVRDGIINHCGEIDETALTPREEPIDLNSINSANEISPFTWEACVVKVADKISYIGRDIEDALRLNIIHPEQIDTFRRDLKKDYKLNAPEVTNSKLLHESIKNLCQNSNPDNGISFSEDYFKIITELKNFNNVNIYNNPRLDVYKKYARLIIESIYFYLKNLYQGQDTLKNLEETNKMHHPLLTKFFKNWLVKYTDIDLEDKAKHKYKNNVIFEIKNIDDYKKSIIIFLSGMTDQFAISVFNELISFR